VRYPLVEEKLDAKQVTLDELLVRADYISVHVPLLPSTRNIIGREQLAKTKKGAILINTARGGVIDEAALIDALERGHLAGAGLDVYTVEPTPDDNPLFLLENVILSPHMAAHTDDALKAMSMIAVDVLRVLEDQEPNFRVV
jgi:D-3-phosphoglycerate dehydrogenase